LLSPLPSSTVAITNYLKKPDIDLTEAMTEARVVIKRLSDEKEVSSSLLVA
jgi:hypothetical protein